LILLPATLIVLPLTFCLRAPVRFLLPCDLQLLTQLAGSEPVGLEQTPLGAGPMFSCVDFCTTSNIFTMVFNLIA
jgi:hypothetical protein